MRPEKNLDLRISVSVSGEDQYSSDSVRANAGLSQAERMIGIRADGVQPTAAGRLLRPSDKLSVEARCCGSPWLTIGARQRDGEIHGVSISNFVIYAQNPVS